MQRHAEAAGLGDVVIVNTCAVTAEATRQARQAIRRLAREQPRGAHRRHRLRRADRARDLRGDAGSRDRSSATTRRCRPRPGRALKDFGVGATEKVVVDDIMAVRETAVHLIDGMRGRTRAFVQVQNGCDHRCTFCIIPYGRGNSRSVPMGAVVEQVRNLVEHGSREVVLTGVDITSYGKDLPGEPKLGALVKAILRHVPELERLRLSSIDSVEADRDLLDAIASEAAADAASAPLAAGRRRPRPEAHEAPPSARRRDRASATEVRRLRPDIVFGADIIAGFPTETEEMFERSLAIVEECGLTHLHVFPFSPRPGHAGRAHAARSRATVVKERARRLREMGEAALRAASCQRGRRAPQRARRDRAARPDGRLHPRCASPPRSAPARSARSPSPATTGEELLAA